MRKTTTPPADTRPPVGISYLRFSDPQQRKGDSIRRQTEGSEAWCQKNNVPLDRNLSCQDKGRSAYHGKHRSDKADLGKFLELVKQGQVPRGSYLIIENLDRLSREEERTALKLWIDILDAGINIVQLHPETIFRHERSDMTDIIRAIIELSRGHSESRAKSFRAKANWDKAFRLAREGKNMTPRRKDGRITKVITGRLPAWIEERDGRPQLIPERAAIVKRMFAMAAAGYGCGAIVKTLVREGVAPFCAREKGADGKHRTGEGCGRWNRMYVRWILTDRRAIGEHQPRSGRKPEGPPLTNYFPAVVSEAEFYAARAASAGRKQKQGRIGNGVACVFGGLLHDAMNAKGGTYTVGTRVTRDRKDRSQSRTRHVLVNSSYSAAREPCASFPLDTFERAILSQLRELDPADVLGREEGPADAAVLEGELAWVRGKKAELEAELLKGDVAEIGSALRSLKAREADLVTKLDQAGQEAAKPMLETWRDAKNLIELLDNAPDKENIRLRLRAALRRIVSGIWMVVAESGRDRLCEAQVWFADGEHYRSYIIIHRPSRSNGKGGTLPGRWWVKSIKHPEAAEAGFPFNVEDLRDSTQAECVKSFLENYPKNMIERLLAKGHPLP
jgi:DNA invertase Pin-like site-specific DNA recombinase